MKRYCVQFMSGTRWIIEAPRDSVFTGKDTFLLVTRMEIVTDGNGGTNLVSRGVAWLNPETIEAIWEAAE